MIIKNLQHELFERGERNRLVYLVNPFEGDTERVHSKRIEDLEAADAATPTGGEIEKLTEGINELKGQIYELTQLLAEGQDEAGNLLLDPIARTRGYNADDAVYLGPAVVFANAAPEPIDNATDFVEQLTAYRTAFDNIKAITFDEPISDWLPEGGDLSYEIPEIGLWNFSEVLQNGTVTARAGATISLYNEHGLQLQIPAGGDFEVRKNEPLRYYSNDVTTSTGLGYLIPIWYGGQELYIIVNDLELPTLSIAPPTASGTNFEYTRPADTARDIDDEIKFTLDRDFISGDDHNWHGVLALATEYEIAKEGDVDAYMEKLYSEAMDKLDKRNPTIGDAATAIEYAHRRYYLDISGGKFGDTAYLQAKASFIAAKLSTDPAGRADNLSLARTMMSTYDGLREDQKTRPDEMAQLELEVTAYETAQLEDVPAHEERILSHEIPEIGIWSFSEILQDGTVTAKSGGSMFLHDEHDIKIRIPSGETFEVRKDVPLRYSTDLNDYLIPVSYGGQELYVFAESLELPQLAVTSTASGSGSDFEYTRPVDDTRRIAEQKFTLTTDLLSDGGTTWENIITLARHYEMAKEGSPRAYARKLFDEGAKKLLGTPSVGNMQSAFAYSDEAYFADEAYADAWYLDAWARMELIKAGDTSSTIRDVRRAITEYESITPVDGDTTSKTSDTGISRLKFEIEAYEAYQLEDVPAHPEPILDRLGGDASVLFSQTLRDQLARLKEGLILPTLASSDIAFYKEVRGELEQTMEIERILATEYLARGDDQPIADLLELYFDIKANRGAYLRNLLRWQLTEEGMPLYAMHRDYEMARRAEEVPPIIFLDERINDSIVSLQDVISEFVEAQIKRRIDFTKEAIIGEGVVETEDLPDATAVARQLFIIKGADIFDKLDVYEDGVLILSLQGTVYAIEKGAEEGKTRELTISYVGKDGRKHIREIFKAPAGVLTMIADNIEVEKGEEGKEARELKAGLIAAAGLPDMQLPAVKLAAGSKQRDTTELVTRLTDASRASRASASAEGDAAGAPTPTEIGTTEGGEATAVAEEAGGGELAGDETTAETGESTASEGETATAEASEGTSVDSAPTETATGGSEGSTEEPEAPEPPTDKSNSAAVRLASLTRRPPTTKVTPEMEDDARRETVKDNTEAMNKYRIEKLVYRGLTYNKDGENPDMVKVFAESEVKDLMDFYNQVGAMRDGRSGRRTHKDSWNEKFRGLLKGAGVKVSDSGDIHLIGRPLILYNTIRRAIEEGARNNVTIDHGLTGDEWLDAMAAQQYLVSHKGESYVKGVPQVHPEHPDRMESTGAILTDIYNMKEDEERGYMVYVTSSGRDVPYVFKITKKRTGEYEVDYGDDRPAEFINGPELYKRFLDGILMDKLHDGRKGKWTDLHAFRVDNVSDLNPAKLREYHREFMENITLEESEARVEKRTILLLKEISKKSKLPLPRLKKLLERRHSDLLAKVADIHNGIPMGPGVDTLDKFEYVAAMLYLKKIGYEFRKRKSDGKIDYIPTDEVLKEDSDPAIDNLRDMVREDIEAEGTASADDIIPEEEEAGRLAGKETDKPAPAHRASAMEKLVTLGVPEGVARRAKRIYTKFVDHLWANSGGITVRRMDYIRFGFPAKEYKSRMGNRLAIAEFGNMIGKIEGSRTRGRRTEGLRAALFNSGVDTRDLPLFTSDNTVDDTLLRMAAIAALAETQELSCSVAYVLGDSDRAGPKIASRGEGYASPRLRKSVYRRYT